MTTEPPRSTDAAHLRILLEELTQALRLTSGDEGDGGYKARRILLDRRAFELALDCLVAVESSATQVRKCMSKLDYLHAVLEVDEELDAHATLRTLDRALLVLEAQIACIRQHAEERLHGAWRERNALRRT